METVFSVLVGLFFAVGIYLILSKHIIRILLGIAVFGNAVNLLIFTSRADHARSRSDHSERTWICFQARRPTLCRRP